MTVHIYYYPPFHTGMPIRILSGFWHSHWHANPGSIRIKTRIANPGGKQDLDPGLQFAYVIAISLVQKKWRKRAVERLRDEVAIGALEQRQHLATAFKVQRGTTLSFEKLLRTRQKVCSSVLWLKFELKSRL